MGEAIKLKVSCVYYTSRGTQGFIMKYEPSEEYPYLASSGRRYKENGTTSQHMYNIVSISGEVDDVVLRDALAKHRDK